MPKLGHALRELVGCWLWPISARNRLNSATFGGVASIKFCSSRARDDIRLAMWIAQHSIPTRCQHSAHTVLVQRSAGGEPYHRAKLHQGGTNRARGASSEPVRSQYQCRAIAALVRYIDRCERCGVPIGLPPEVSEICRHDANISLRQAESSRVSLNSIWGTGRSSPLGCYPPTRLDTLRTVVCAHSVHAGDPGQAEVSGLAARNPICRGCGTACPRASSRASTMPSSSCAAAPRARCTSPRCTASSASC